MHKRTTQRRRALAAGALIVAVHLSAIGCAPLSHTVDVLVGLPESPGHWEEVWGSPGFRISWRSHPGAGGETQTRPGVREIALSLPKGSVTAMLAWPVWPSGGPALQPGEAFRPAGGIWAGDRTEGDPDPSMTNRHFLTWLDGPAAFVVSEVARLGADTGALNHERLIAEIAERVPGDRWLLDTGRVIRAFCERSMRANYIRAVPLTPIRTELPEGHWVGGSPFRAPIDGGIHELMLPPGVSTFYDGQGRRLVISLDRDGRGWVAISPPR